MRSGSGLFLSFLFAALIFPDVLFAGDSVTLTTYYPAPAGSYQSMRSTKMCIGQKCHDRTAEAADNNLYVEGAIGIGTTNPAAKLEVKGGVKLGTDTTCTAAKVGTMIFDSNVKQVQVCQDTGSGVYAFVAVGGGASDIWIGGAQMSAPVQQTEAGIISYYSPARTYSYGYYLIANWDIKSGSASNFQLYYPYLFYMPITNSHEPVPGNYKIVYGGGQVKFFTGKRYSVQLWVYTNGTGWSMLDNYYIENPSASDGAVFSNSGSVATGGGGVVDIPVRTVQVAYLANAWSFEAELIIQPMFDTLDWSSEIGTQFASEADWLAAGSPQLPCLDHMRTDLCGSGAYWPSTTYTWWDYYYSNYYLKIADQRAAGTIEGISFDVYRSQ